jgi:hypothetical protein
MGSACLLGMLYIRKHFHDMKARNLPKIKRTGIFFGVAFRLVVVIIVVISIIILLSVVGLRH